MSASAEACLLEELYAVILRRRGEAAAQASNSYVASLFARGSDRIIQKLGEEACEVVIAAKNRKPDALVNEVADLVFHLLVLLADQDVEPAAVRAELARRFGISGLSEKAARSG